jgi:aspartyl aminopeptidase
MTVTKPATPVSKPMSLKEKQVYWAKTENVEKSLELLEKNILGVYRLASHLKEGVNHENSKVH